MGGIRATLTGALIALAVGGMPEARAEVSDAPALSVDFKTGVAAEDAPGAATGTARSDLRFGVIRSTKGSSVEASLGAWAEARGRAKAGLDHLRLSYARTTRQSTLTAHLRVEEATLSSEASLIDPVTGDFVTVVDPGRRRAMQAALSLRTGIGERVEFNLDLRRGATRYIGTVSPSYNDSDSWSAAVTAKLRVSPVAHLGGEFGVHDERTLDGLDSQRRVGFGRVELGYDLNPVTSFSVGIGHSWIDQSGAAGLVDRRGTTLVAGVTREHRRGHVGLRYARTVESSGTRDLIEVSARLEQPRGELKGSLGYTRTAQHSGPIAALTYRHEMARGQIHLSAARRFATSGTGAPRAVSETRLLLDREVTARGTIRFEAEYQAVGAAPMGGAAVSRASVALTYDHRLTRDWSLEGGLRHLATRQAGQSGSRRNTIFVTLSRSFMSR